MQPASIIHIRQAVLDDLPEILTLFVGTIQHTCQNDYNAEQIAAWTASVDNKSRWQDALADQYFLVAEIDNKLVGFSSLEHGNYLDFMYVHYAYERRGIAHTLYQAIETEARRLGSTFITAYVSKTARSFFEKQGFKVVKENKNLIRSIELINYKMIKNIENLPLTLYQQTEKT